MKHTLLTPIFRNFQIGIKQKYLIPFISVSKKYLCGKFLSTQKGTATGIALAFSAGIMTLSLTTVVVVNHTMESNKNIQNASSAYFAAERGIEYALLDIAGHASGYENPNENLSGNNDSTTDIEIESQSTNNWNTINQGEGSTIPLYIDNTGK